MARSVCILAAGKGSRLGRLTRYVNKALVPVAYQPVISRIIAKFPFDTRYVIAVGHLESLVRDYLGIAHPDLDVQFVKVDTYEGEGSGPGYSLLCCHPYLQEPFVLTTCDTLVEEAIPDVDADWIGVAVHPEIERFCSVRIDGQDRVQRIDYREKRPDNLAFIGLAGIHRTERFWAGLAGDRRPIFGEHQISNGLAALLDGGLQARRFTWFDTGDIEGLNTANRHYQAGFVNFDKENEFLYFVEGSVIKFFANPEIVRRRVERSRVLGPVCPRVVATRPNFYRYEFVDGRSFSQCVDDQRFSRFLTWCREHLWVARPLAPDACDEFRRLCRRFYEEKTRQRLEQFYASTGLTDEAETINGYAVAPVRELLNRVDWEGLSGGVPVGFHGDLHFDNTVIPTDPRDGEFKLLDWRQDFGGRIEYGDWYYDLAKIHHELIISHDEIKANTFRVERGADVRFSYLTRSEYLSCQKVMRRFVEEQGLDYRRVLLITHLIFLNMAPLHHHPFNLLLYYLGKLGLHQWLVEGHEQL